MRPQNISLPFLLIASIASNAWAGRPMTAKEAEAQVTQPFFTRALSDFRIAKTYYVAIHEKGASNNNDGLSPTYQGGKKGPFKNLTHPRVRALLVDQKDGVQLVLRAGIYNVSSDDPKNPKGGSGLVLRGQGDEFHPVILTSYPGETAILDGRENLPRKEVIKIVKGKHYKIKIRQVIQLEGQYNIVQNLTIRNGWRHNVNVLGKHSIIRNNILLGAFEDSVKTARDADQGLLESNNISGFGSQGLEHAGAHDWLIKNNDFHHPDIDPVMGFIAGNAITAKGGIRNVVIVGNKMHDFDTDIQRAAISLGTPGSKDTLRWVNGRLVPSVTRAFVAGNAIDNFRGSAVHFGSCHDCSFLDNTISGTVGAFHIGIQPVVRNTAKSLGFPPTSQGILIRHNRFAGNNAHCKEPGAVKMGMTCYTFYVESRADTEGLVSEHNAYYSDNPPAFVNMDGGTNLIGHDDFVRAYGTDSTSRILPYKNFSR